jgi:hypothetical protein
MMEFVSSFKDAPQGLKPSSFVTYTARLKSCPDTKRLGQSIHGPRAQGDKQHSLSSNRFAWKRFPSLCHPACPGVPWGDLRFHTRPWVSNAVPAR